MDVHGDVGVVTVDDTARDSRWVARRSRAADVLLTIGAVLGSACIGLVIVALLFGVRIMLFSTGSMAPTIPVDSVALAQTVDASEVRVGDVVTVARPGKLPITHRVVAIEEIDSDAGARRITMRGDANSADDPLPYDVVEVQRVFFSIPFGARFVSSLNSPWVLGGLTIVATAIVVAAFWPRRREVEAES